VPVYRRIINDIRQPIATGQLRAGDKLPSITQLMEEYKCSDTPVKTALGRLQDAGWVEGHQGRGVYVAATTAEAAHSR
jgi:DNA-binding GntR family transcriptional regulator